MRRADRLFQIVQLLRRSRATTAAHIATELEVSERTVYRDVQDLMVSGIPIQGEAGVGYALPPHFDLPPLMFDAQEIQALVLGARMVQGWSDAELARAARSALQKIEHVLPKHLASRLEDNKLFVPDFHIPKEQHAAMRAVRQGLDESKALDLDYGDESGQRTQRRVRPLGLFYWGRSWTLTAWCELRTDFRNFRLDRIVDARLGGPFAPEPGRTLEDFLARMREVKALPAPAQSDQRSASTPAVRRTAGGMTKAGSRRHEPADPDERRAWKEFQQLGSIGPACALDLVQLGFRSIQDLCGQDATMLYERLAELSGMRHDPCVEDALRCAIAQADHPDLPAEWRQWHRWGPLRGKPAGTMPPELPRRRRAT
jgi:predicted DNA-binding transcriptional regulator YafY